MQTENESKNAYESNVNKSRQLPNVQLIEVKCNLRFSNAQRQTTNNAEMLCLNVAPLITVAIGQLLQSNKGSHLDDNEMNEQQRSIAFHLQQLFF